MNSSDLLETERENMDMKSKPEKTAVWVMKDG